MSSFRTFFGRKPPSKPHIPPVAASSQASETASSAKVHVPGVDTPPESMTESEASGNSAPASQRDAPQQAPKPPTAEMVRSASTDPKLLKKELNSIQEKTIALQNRCFYLEGELTAAIASAQKAHEYVQELEMRLANAHKDEQSTEERYAATRMVLSERTTRVQELEAQLATAFAASSSRSETESQVEQHKIWVENMKEQAEKAAAEANQSSEQMRKVTDDLKAKSRECEELQLQLDRERSKGEAAAEEAARAAQTSAEELSVANEGLRVKTLEFDQLRMEMDEVIAQLAHAPARGPTPCPQADEVKDLQDRLQKATQDLAALRSEQGAFSTLKVQWERDAADLTAQLARAQHELADMHSREEGGRRAHQREAEVFTERQAQMEGLQRQLELTAAEAAAVWEQRDQALAELDSTNQKWHVKMRQVTIQLDDARKEIVNQRARVEELERELSRAAFRSAEKAAAASMVALRKALSDKHLLEAAYKKATMLAIRMRSECLQAKTHLEKATNERDTALSTVAAAEKYVEVAKQSEAKALAELTASKDRLSELDNLLSAKTIECKDLNAALAKTREEVSADKSQLSKANVEVQSLSAKLSSSEAQSTKLAHQLDLLRAEMAALGRELEGERSSKKLLQEDATKAAAISAAQRDTLQETKEKMIGVEYEVRGLQALLKSKDDEATRIHNRVTALQRENNDLVAQLAETNAQSAASLAGLGSQLSATSDQARIKEEAVNKVTQDLAAKERECSELSARMQKTDADLADLLSRLEKAHNDLRDQHQHQLKTTSELGAKTQACEDLAKQLDKANTELLNVQKMEKANAEALAAMTKDCGAKDVALTKSTAEAAAVKKELGVTCAELAAKQQEVADLAAQLMAVQSSAAQKMSDHDEASLRQGIGDLTTQLKQAQAEAESANRQLAHTQQSLSSKTQECKNLAEQLRKAEREVLEGRVQAATAAEAQGARAQELKDKVAHLLRVEAELKEARERQAKSDERLASKTAECSAAEVKRAASESAAAAAGKQLKEVEAQLQAARKERDRAAAQLSQARQELEAAKSAAASASSTLATEKLECSGLQIQLKALESDMAELRRELENMDQEKKSFVKESHDKAAALAKAEADAANARKEGAKLQEQMSVLSTSRDETAVRLSRSEASAAALEMQLQEAKQRLAELANQLQARTRETADLAQKATAAQAEMTTARRELTRTHEMLVLKTKEAHSKTEALVLLRKDHDDVQQRHDQLKEELQANDLLAKARQDAAELKARQEKLAAELRNRMREFNDTEARMTSVLKSSPNVKERSALDAMEDAKQCKQDQMDAMRKLDESLQNSDEVMGALNAALKEAATVIRMRERTFNSVMDGQCSPRSMSDKFLPVAAKIDEKGGRLMVAIGNGERLLQSLMKTVSECKALRSKHSEELARATAAAESETAVLVKQKQDQLDEAHCQSGLLEKRCGQLAQQLVEAQAEVDELVRKHMEAELALGASQKECLRLKQHAERVDYAMQTLTQKLREAEKIKQEKSDMVHELELLNSQMHRYTDIEQHLVTARAELADVREHQAKTAEELTMKAARCRELEAELACTMAASEESKTSSAKALADMKSRAEDREAIVAKLDTMTVERNNLQSRIYKLEHTLQDHTQKVAELAAKEQQRRQLERDLDIAGSQLQAAELNRDALAKQLAEATARIEELKSKEMELARVAAQLAESNAQRDELAAQLASTTVSSASSAEVLNNQSKELQATQTQLTQALEDAKAQAEYNQGLRDQLATSQEEKSLLEAALKKSLATCVNYRRQLEQAVVDLRELSEQMQELDAGWSQSAEQLQEARVDLESTASKLELAEAQVALRTMLLEQKSSELEVANEDLQQSTKSLAQARAELRMKGSDLDDTTARFKELAALLDTARKDLQDAQNSLNINQAELDGKSQDCVDLAARLDAAALEHADMLKTINTLNEQAQEAAQTIGSLRDKDLQRTRAEAELAATQAQLAAAQGDAGRMSEQLAAMNQLRDRLAERSDELAEARRMYNEMAAERDELAAQMSEMGMHSSATLSDLEKKVLEAQAEARSLEGKLAKVQVDMQAELANQQQAAEAKLAEQKEAVLDAQARLEEELRKVAELREQVEDNAHLRDVLEKSLAKSLEYKSRMEAAEASLKSKSTQFDEQAIRLVRTLADAKEAEDRSKELEKQLEKTVRDMDRKLSKAEKDLERSKTAGSKSAADLLAKQKECQELNAQLAQALAEREALSIQVDKMGHEAVARSERVAKLEARDKLCRQLERDVDIVQSQLAAMTLEKDSLQTQLDSAKLAISEGSETSTKLVAARAECEKLRCTVQTTAQERDNLLVQISEVGARSVDTSSNLERQLAQARAATEEARAALTSKERELSDLQAGSNRLAMDAAALREYNLEQRQAVEAKSLALDKALAALAAEQEEKARLAEQLRTTTTQLQAKSRAYDESAESAKEAARQKQDEIKRLRSELESKSRDCARLEGELPIVQRQLDTATQEATAKAKALEKATQEAEELRKSLKKTTTDLAAMAKRCSDLEARATTAETNMEKARLDAAVVRAELSTKSHEFKQAGNSLAAAQAEVALLTTQLAAASDTLANKTAEYVEKLNTATAAIQKGKEEQTKTVAELGAVSQDCVRLEKEFAAVKKQLQKAEADLQAESQGHKKTSTEAADLKGQLVRITKDLSDKTQHCQKVEAQQSTTAAALESMTCDVAATAAELAAKIQDCKQLELLLSEKTTERGQLWAEVEKLKRQAEVSAHQLEAVKKEAGKLKGAESEITALRQQLAAAQAENNKLTEEMAEVAAQATAVSSSADQQLAEALAEMGKLRVEIEALRVDCCTHEAAAKQAILDAEALKEQNMQLSKSFNLEKIDKNHLRRTLEKALAKSKLYKETMEANAADMKVLQADKEIMMEQIEDLRNALNEKNSLNAKLQATLAELEAQLATTKRAKDDLNESLAAAGETMAEQARVHSETSAELAKSQRECAAANTKLGNLGHELDRMSEQLRKLTGVSKERDDVQHELELAKSQLGRYANLEDELIMYKAEGQDAKRDAAAAMESLAARERECKTLKSTIDNLVADVAALKELEAGTAAELNAAVKQCIEKDEELTKALEEVASKNADLLLTKETVEQKSKECAETTHSLTMVWVEVEGLRERLRLKTEECEEKTSQLAYVLGEDVNAKMKECEEKAAQLARAQRETEELKKRQERVAYLNKMRADSAPAESKETSRVIYSAASFFSSFG